MSKVLKCGELGFVMLRKSCTTSLKNVTREYYGLDNSEHIHKDKRLRYGSGKGLKTVCIIRDPRTRILSAWQNKMHDQKSHGKNELVSLGFKQGCTFEDFVNHARYVYKKEAHIQPQVEQIPSKIDYVLCFERIDEDWQKLQVIYDWLPNLNINNSAKYDKKNWRKYYTPEILKTVKKMYRADFELWDKVRDSEGLCDPR
jgi:predicted transcriptional regulator YdeE